MTPTRPTIPSKPVQLTFHTTPHTCGTITYNGSVFSNGGVNTFSTGVWPISATPCPTWHLVSLTGSGGVSIAAGSATVTGPGNISAVFSGYYYTISFVTSPTTCGTISLNGTAYVDTGMAMSSPGQFPLSPTPCPGYYTSTLTGTGGVTVSGPTAIIIQNGTITATFLPADENVTVESTPTVCGGVNVATTNIPSSQTREVLSGTYTYGAYGCQGYVLTGVSGAQGVSVTPNVPPTTGSVSILGAGFINLTFTPTLYNLTFLIVPGNQAGYVVFNGVKYHNDSQIQVSINTTGNIAAMAEPYWTTGSPTFVFSGGVGWLNPGTSILIWNNSVVTTYFIPIWYTVTFNTPESPCKLSSVQFNASAFSLVGQGAQVKQGTYTVSGASCEGFAFVSYGSSGDVGTSAALAPVSATVWVNGSGSITVNFSPLWLTASGFVRQWPNGPNLTGATVWVFYGGDVVNQTGPTGVTGTWSVSLVYGTYSVNATLPRFTASAPIFFKINGNLSGTNGLVVWVNATLGLPGPPQGALGFVSSYPGILVPIITVIVVVGVVLVLYLRRKWLRMPPALRPGGPPGPVAPGAPMAQLPPGSPRPGYPTRPGPYPPSGPAYRGGPPPVPGYGRPPGS